MTHADPSRRDSIKASSPTRRAFVVGASAAGAVLLNGYSALVAMAHGARKRGPKRPTCVALTSNGQEAVTSDDNGELKVRHAPNFKEPVKTADKKHQFKASYVSVSGRLAVTAGYDGYVIVHDLDDLNAQNPPVLNTHDLGVAKPEVWVATLSADGSHVLLGTNDGQIMLWEIANPNLQQIKRFRYSRDPVAGLAFVPLSDDQMFMSTHAGVVNLWRTSNPFEPLTTYSHKNSQSVNAVAINPDATKFVSGSFDRTVRVWDLNTAAHVEDPKPLHVLRHSDIVWRVAMSPDALFVASAGDDDVRVWRVSDEAGVRFPVGTFGSMGVAFHGNSKIVYTGDGTNAANLVNAGAPVFPVARDAGGAK
jgi:WD40 repeat protein